jgi:hypothetical protein
MSDNINESAHWMTRYRQAIRIAKRITGMLQGTMGLEGQALDRKTLKQMSRQTTNELLGKRSSYKDGGRP